MLDRIDKNLMLFSNKFLKQKEYWNRKLSGDIEKTDILFDQYENKKGNSNVTRNQKRKHLPILMPENLCAGLMKISKKIDLSLYLLLLTGLKTLIFRYTNREDLVVISPIYKQRILGETINNFLFIRSFISGYMTFKELLLEIRESLLNAYENQDYPFDKLIEHLFPRAGNDGFVSNISCSLGNIHNHDSIEILPIKLAFAFNREGNRITGHVIYEPNIVADAYLQQISNHFTRILQEAADDINIKISKILILSDQERRKLLLEFNDTQAIYSTNKTIVELFEQQVEKKPDNIVLVFGDKNISYRDLNKRSNQLGKNLGEKGTAINSIVGIMLKPSMEMLIGIIGILKAGGAFLPMEPEHPGPRIKYMLMDTGAGLLLTGQHQRGKYSNKVQTINLEDKRLYKGKGLNPEKRTSPADLTYVIYTSGTTGNPKGVPIKNENLVNYISWFVKEIGITREDKAILTSSFAFDALYTQLFASILKGGEIHAIPRETFLIPQRLLSYMRVRKITYIKVTPSLFNIVVNSPGFSLEMFRKIRFIMLGGEPINVKDVEQVYRVCRHIKIMNHYGPTEATIGSIARYIDRDKFEDYKKKPTIGKPISNTQVYILDKYLELVPLGVPGELCIGGEGVGMGYLNNIELTVEKFTANPFVRGGRIYRTGDLASWQPDGNIKFSGRMDDQIKIRGCRVEVGGIENLLLKHDEIKDAAVIHKNGNLCAYVVAEKKLIKSRLREYLSKKLPGYMIPSYFMQLERIPLTAHNKIDREALPEPEVTPGSEYTAPRTPMEEKLVKIWSEVLAVKKNMIGIKSNFFELGGHSLKATIVVSKMYQELDVNIPLAEMFRSPTIERLAQYLQGTARDSYTFIKPVEEKEYYGLSPAQKRLYILQQIEIKTTAYNIPRVAVLEGSLEKKKIENAFGQSIKRHESLRTSFEMVCEEPVQRIHDEVEFEIEYYQVEDKVKVTVEEMISNFIRFFDLSQSPLLRVGLIKTGEKKHILMLDIHHIISDGVSQAIYVKELMDLYEGRERLPIKTRYKDYVEWKNSQAEQEAVKKQEEYWLKEFSLEIPVLNLPLDYKRPLIQSFEGNSLQFDISREETELLKNLVLEEASTLYILLMGVYNIFLSKISCQEEIVIGTPTAGRRLVELNQVIGMFVNTLALKNYPLGVKTCKDFLTEVKERTLQAFENQDYQFEDLVDRTSVSRDPGRNPLFDTMFTLNNIDITEIEITGLILTPYESKRNFSKFDLTLSAEEVEDRLCFAFEYCTKLFKRETIERFIHYFKRIISSVIENPGKKISEIEIITGEERKQLLHDFNATAAVYPKDKALHQLFQEQAAALPDHTILVWGEKQLTYKELNGKVNQLARLLRARGLASNMNAVVGLMVKPSPEMVVGVLGILKAGAAYLPIDPGYPEKRKKHMLKDSEAKLSICHDPGNDIGDSVANIGECELINIGNDYFTGVSSDLEVSFTPGDLIYTIFTSGSTGKPKGVGVYHKSFLNLVYWYVKEFTLNANDSVLLITSLSFDLTQKNIFAPLITGGKLHLPEEDHYNHLSVSQTVWKKEITWLNCTPGMFYPLVEEEENFKKLTSLRYVFLGGEPIALPLINRCLQTDYFNAELVNTYGPTECTDVCSYYRIKLTETFNDGLSSIPIGKPINNVQLFVLDGYWHPQPLGVAGELLIGGEGLGIGYLNDISMTSEKFITISLGMNWGSQLYRTGDLVRWLADGNLEFLGRIDQQVKVRGFRIELGEIESQMLKHVEINECLVVAPSDKTGDKYLCAYIVSNRQLEISILREYLAKSLPGYMIPSYFVFLDRIPLNPNGKVNRSALPVPQLKTGQKDTTPRNRIEERLVQLWAGLLGIEKSVINTDSDFFELGGHSLKATVMTAKVHKQFHVRLPLAEIFKHPTIRELAQYIGTAAQDRYTYLEVAQKKEYYPLSSAQKRLYVIQQMAPESTSYNIQLLKKVKGELSRRKVETIFRKLIERHETLRTSFEMVSEEPVQKIHHKVEFEIEFHDFSTKTAENTEGVASPIYYCFRNAQMPEERYWNDSNTEEKPGGEETSRELRAKICIVNFLRPFDLIKAPLMRVGLIKINENEHILMVDMHHIVMDGISQGILEEELIALYHDRKLPPLTLQYKDYSEWQNSDEQKQALKQQEMYWLKSYQGEIPVLNLPLDYVRPPVQQFEGGYLDFSIGGEPAAELKTMAVEQGATLYMVLLALYDVLLAKISGQEDIVVGTPVSGRYHSDLESIIGMFVNTLALRNYPSADKGFIQFLGEVKQRTIQAFDNQDYPFEELVEKLETRRDTGRNPLFDTMFTFETQQDQPLNLHESMEVKIEPYEYENRTAKFDIALNAVENEHDLHFNIEYSTKLFKKETIRRFATYFKDIVTSVSNNRNVKLKDIQISLELTDSKSTISHEAQGAFGF